MRQRTYCYRNLLLVLAPLLVMAMVTAPASADEVQLTPDRDNTLYENRNGSLSNGSGDYIFAGTTANLRSRRALLRFDVAGVVPPGAVITGAQLSMNMSRAISGEQPVSLHTVLADWGESTSNAGGEEGGGTVAAEGDATWIHTFSPSETWQNEGGDFNSDPSATTGVAGLGSYIWQSDQLVADVQAWVDNPESNFGWIVIGNESISGTAKRFDSRENPVVENRPVLTLQFETGATFARFKVITASVRFNQPRKDSLFFSSIYELGQTTDGIDPENETVQVTLGPFSQSIEPGSFRCHGKVCKFRSDKPGIRFMIITKKLVAVWADRVDLTSISNPTPLMLAIGDDSAETELGFRGRLKLSETKPNSTSRSVAGATRHR